MGTYGRNLSKRLRGKATGDDMVQVTDYIAVPRRMVEPFKNGVMELSSIAAKHQGDRIYDFPKSAACIVYWSTIRCISVSKRSI
jgi:hypothetical protein